MSENNEDDATPENVVPTPETSREEDVTISAQESSEKEPVDSDTIRLDMRDFVEKEQEAEPEANTDEPATEQPTEEVVEAVAEEAQEEIPSLELVEESDEEPEEEEPVAEEPTIEQPPAIELPENVQSLVDFINETGGTVEDYVLLNKDISELDDKAMLREYYQQSKPHLDSSEIDFLIEDKFDYEEDVDSDREIRRKKLAFKEEVNTAQKHLKGMREKYYQDIKSGSRLTPDQQKAVEFFNRHNAEAEETSKVVQKQTQTFLDRTDKVFSDKFKGFEYEVGDKKYRVNVKDSETVKTAQSNINNFVKKFLGDDGTIKDAKGYHKSLFTAMNPDVIANHFYEQGKADAMKDSIQRSKNVDMDPRGTHEKVDNIGGFKVRAVSGDDSSKLRFKLSK